MLGHLFALAIPQVKGSSIARIVLISMINRGLSNRWTLLTDTQLLAVWTPDDEHLRTMRSLSTSLRNGDDERKVFITSGLISHEFAHQA